MHYLAACALLTAVYSLPTSYLKQGPDCSLSTSQKCADIVIPIILGIDDLKQLSELCDQYYECSITEKRCSGLFPPLMKFDSFCSELQDRHTRRRRTTRLRPWGTTLSPPPPSEEPRPPGTTLSPPPPSEEPRPSGTTLAPPPPSAEPRPPGTTLSPPPPSKEPRPPGTTLSPPPPSEEPQPPGTTLSPPPGTEGPRRKYILDCLFKLFF
ncbi:Vegetative cell wall protein gp1-like [Caenorhabditis elegans]|uniref:Vegetative cell wall protein gp1-like n=1 Tax=Caenorhabditis elegans TaxID=6239 RepID=D2YW05_CAEEL|nr:Vegetative cell wall protein gp1-like [Caenorhabditis elegans]CBI83228.1 Vegetative cell wall protein gp1-like [Caenorhabditis elegans]|eukprot:NP_001257243.1 Uncharacterized protein CELE_E02H4.8 [Caenorhabditis elegans]